MLPNCMCVVAVLISLVQVKIFKYFNHDSLAILYL